MTDLQDEPIGFQLTDAEKKAIAEGLRAAFTIIQNFRGTRVEERALAQALGPLDLAAQRKLIETGYYRPGQQTSNAEEMRLYNAIRARTERELALDVSDAAVCVEDLLANADAAFLDHLRQGWDMGPTVLYDGGVPGGFEEDFSAGAQENGTRRASVHRKTTRVDCARIEDRRYALLEALHKRGMPSDQIVTLKPTESDPDKQRAAYYIYQIKERPVEEDPAQELARGPNRTIAEIALSDLVRQAVYMGHENHDKDFWDGIRSYRQELGALPGFYVLSCYPGWIDKILNFIDRKNEAWFVPLDEINTRMPIGPGLAQENKPFLRTFWLAFTGFKNRTGRVPTVLDQEKIPELPGYRWDTLGIALRDQKLISPESETKFKRLFALAEQDLAAEEATRRRKAEAEKQAEVDAVWEKSLALESQYMTEALRYYERTQQLGMTAWLPLSQKVVVPGMTVTRKGEPRAATWLDLRTSLIMKRDGFMRQLVRPGNIYDVYGLSKNGFEDKAAIAAALKRLNETGHHGLVPLNEAGRPQQTNVLRSSPGNDGPHEGPRCRRSCQKCTP